VAEIDADLLEWDYGQYEGKTSIEIRRDRPHWQLFRDGCPGGETLADVAARADQVLARLRALADDALLFSSSHFLRVFVARWLGLEPAAGRCFYLGTAALSAVGYEHGADEPIVRLWNDTTHVRS
jgi:probable phosphoglycerate mutase